ncbi:MAG: alpha/beta fold hydrolase [Granulosicoccus sp.]
MTTVSKVTPWLLALGAGLMLAHFYLLSSITGNAGARADTLASGAEQFPQAKANFNHYINNMRSYLQPRSLPGRTDTDLELNLPFQIKANPTVTYRGRFLLFHGLNDSAYVWRDMARAIAKRGFDTRAILFEGHGSTPKDMLDVKYQSWLSTARQHLAIWNDNKVPMYLGGFSMGATIATLLALDNPEVDGLFLISPAYHSKLNNYLRWSGIYAKFRPWVFGGMILEDNPMKYNSIPVNSGWQFYCLTEKLKSRWQSHRLDMPVLMVATEEDSVIDIDYTRHVFDSRFTHEKRHILIYSGTQTPVVADRHAGHQANRWAEYQERRASRFPSKRILNQSHLSLMNSPDNPLFGESAAVLVCNGNEYPIFMACMRSSQHWYGAQHTASPDGVAVARTTYNPDFDSVMQRFDEVLVNPVTELNAADNPSTPR